MDWLSLIGAVLSAIGAAVSIWQVMKIKKYRDEILHDRKKMLLLDINNLAKKARDECKKIITPAGKALRGVDPQQVINAIRDCLDRIKDNGHKFNTTSLVQIIALADDQIDSYIKEKDDIKRYRYGDEIYTSIGKIISSISEEIDRLV